MTLDVGKIRSGDRRQLGKAITLLESTKKEHQKEANNLLSKIMDHKNKSLRVAISGVPGVGKSTFIEALGLHLTGLGKKVAVQAIDPSSPLSGGSILGDKTRMEKLSQSELAFIRPSPTSGALGGVANKTRETTLLLEAAGYEIILIETVGVGQSEYDAASMVDFFMVLMLPNAGDELQGIKKGIVELADAIIINKVDGDFISQGALAKSQYESALNIIKHESFWNPKVMTCSATQNIGITDISSMLFNFEKEARRNSLFEKKRDQQNEKWLEKLIFEILKNRIISDKKTTSKWSEMKRQVLGKKTSPLLAATEVIKAFLK